MQLALEDFAQRAVSPFVELGAYEALWERPKASFKTLADMFAKREGTLPSDFIERDTAIRYANEVHAKLKAAGIDRYGVRVHGAGEYPNRLRDAIHAVQRADCDLPNPPTLVQPICQTQDRTRLYNIPMFLRILLVHLLLLINLLTSLGRLSSSS